MNLFTLPSELIGQIYEYDPTFHDEFKIVIKQFQCVSMFEKRRKREIQMLETEMEIMSQSLFWVKLIYYGKRYTVFIPPNFPFEHPIVYKDGQRLSKPDWVIVSSIKTLLLTYHIDDDPICAMCLLKSSS
jgi:hypothetical protein